jgi:hypothetical protein
MQLFRKATRCGKTVNYKESLAKQALIYQHLGEHPQILRCLGLEEVHPGLHSLRLELAHFWERTPVPVIEKNAQLPEHTRMQMALDVAVGLGPISRGIVHDAIGVPLQALWLPFTALQTCHQGHLQPKPVTSPHRA